MPPSSCKFYSSFVGSSSCCSCSSGCHTAFFCLLSLDRGDRRLNALHTIGLVRATDTPHASSHIRGISENEAKGAWQGTGRSTVTQQCVRKFVARFPTRTSKRVRHILILPDRNAADRLTVSGSVVESNCPSARDAALSAPICHMPYACDMRLTE